MKRPTGKGKAPGGAAPRSESRSPYSASTGARRSGPGQRAGSPGQRAGSPAERDQHPVTRPAKSSPAPPQRATPARKTPAPAKPPIPPRPAQPPAPRQPFPVAVISHRAAEKLRGGHVWIYRSDVLELRPALDAQTIPAGALVAVEDNRGAPLGTAMYSTASMIALRLFARAGAVAPQENDRTPTPLSRENFLQEVEDRAAAAAALRLPLLTAASDAARIIFSEADRLPGVIADRYAGIIVVQRNTQGLSGEDVAEALTRGLVRGFGQTHRPSIIVERADARIRELEELPPVSPEPWYIASAIARDVHTAGPHPQEGTEPAPAPTASLATEFRINALRFAFDANAGQKTGAFLDQRDNYAAAARHAASAPPVNGSRSALDVCTYQGGFALHLARVSDSVTAVDASRAALEIAERNEASNREQLRAQPIEWLQGDAFALLRDYAAAGRQFSAIVLDPPAFAKSQRAAESALRGYKEMNLRAIQMLPSGGVLVTCSCSHHVSLADFTQAVAAAAADAGRRVTLLESRTAAPDHPVILGIPETMYLKCLICRVD